MTQRGRGSERVREAEVVLTVNNEPDAWLESVDIVTTIPLGYAKLLVEGPEKFADALEADLKEFLASKWKILKGPVDLLARTRKG